nr:class I SAM-dependent methyltransferase [uncultured Methanoregula sp.]
MVELVPEIITQSGWNFSNSMWNSLSEYDKSFVLLHFSCEKTLDFHKKELEHLGFNNLEKVLDAGCGMGQWTIALAELNQSVEGIDMSENRLKIARDLATNHKMINCNFIEGNLEKLPYDDESFDAIYCCQCFMFTHMKKTISEFNRVLKQNGKIFINVNDIGWYVFLIIDKGLKQKQFGSIIPAFNCIFNSFLLTDRNRIVSKKWLTTLFKNAGFDISFCRSEIENKSDEIVKSKNNNPPRNYYGFSTLIELSAIKRN